MSSLISVQCAVINDVLLMEIGYSMVIEVYHIMMKKYINFKFFNPTPLLPVEIAWFCNIPMCFSSY